MKRPLLSALLLICLAAASSSARAQGEGGSELRVKVVSADGPVIGALVTLRGEGARERRAHTDESGECEFARLTAGAYSLKVSKPSFFLEHEAEPLSLDGSQSKTVRVSLTRGGSIAGRLSDADGDPLTGVPVTALRLDPATKKATPPPASESNVTALPDDRGAFRLYGLRPGLYLLAFNARREHSERKALPPVYYPGQPELRAASPLYVGASQEVSLPEVRLAPPPGGAPSVTGRVEGAGGPLPGVAVFIDRPGDESVSDSALSDAEGRFAFEGLPPGRYRLKARPKNGSHRESEQEVVVTEAGAGPLVLKLKEHPALEGVAYLSGKAGREPLPRLSLGLTPAAPGARAADFVSAPDGRFSLRPAPGGLFWWRVAGLRADQYLERVEVGGEDVARRPFRLSAEAGARGVAVYVSTGAASVEGRFAEGEPEACEEFALYLAAAGPNGKQTPFHLTRAGACSEGSFSFQSLAPGKYYLVALPLARGAADPLNEEAHRKAVGAAAEDSRLGPRDIITLGAGQKSTGHTPVRLPLR